MSHQSQRTEESIDAAKIKENTEKNEQRNANKGYM
jgi:hypothetical protein